MSLKIANVSYEHREITLRDKPKAMLDISPKGTVPVLQLADSKVLDESLDIMHWAFAEGKHKFSNVSDTENEIIAENDTSFKQALDRYKYANRYDDQEQVRDKSYAQAILFLEKLEICLQNNKFIVDNEMSFADIAIFPFIRQFSKVDEDKWHKNDFKNLKLWLRFVADTSDFKEIMCKYGPWLPESEILIVNG